MGKSLLKIPKTCEYCRKLFAAKTVTTRFCSKYDRMHELMQTDKARVMRKLRQSTVEPVLGTLVNFLNMKRVNTRGIEQANKHVLMAALAYNLKKYMKYTAMERNRMIVEVKNTLETAIISSISDLFLSIFHFLRTSHPSLIPE